MPLLGRQVRVRAAASTCLGAQSIPGYDLAHRRVVEHDLNRRMTAVQPQVLTAGGIGLHNQNALINTNAQEVAGGIAREPAAEAVLGVVGISNEVGDATDGTPGPVTINVVEELDEPRLLRLHGSLGGKVRAHP